MARKKKKKRLPRIIELLKASGAGLASTTKGRARTFKDRKKEADRNACRGKQPSE